jgi:hypothetical protein
VSCFRADVLENQSEEEPVEHGVNADGSRSVGQTSRWLLDGVLDAPQGPPPESPGATRPRRLLMIDVSPCRPGRRRHRILRPETLIVCPMSYVLRPLTSSDRNVDQPTDVSIRASRALSHLMSGGANYRLEIGSAIASGDGVANTSDLASQLALPRQAVNLELLMLERVGLLRREEQGSGRKVYFTRIPSDYWRWCKDGHTNAEEMLRRNPPF